MKAEIAGDHIAYILDYPKPFRGYGALLYGLATIVPAFVSRIKGMKSFGVLILISYLISVFYFQHAVVSVWCFFAAVISISIYFLIPAPSNKRLFNPLEN